MSILEAGGGLDFLYKLIVTPTSSHRQMYQIFQTQMAISGCRSMVLILTIRKPCCGLLLTREQRYDSAVTGIKVIMFITLKII